MAVLKKLELIENNYINIRSKKAEKIHTGITI